MTRRISLLLIILLSIFFYYSSAEVSAQVTSNSSHCKSEGYGKIYKVGWTEWEFTANAGSRSEEQNNKYWPGYGAGLDNIHKVADPLDNTKEAYRITHRKGYNYGASSKIRSLFRTYEDKNTVNTETNDVCLAYKVYWPENFEFGDPVGRDSAKFGKDGSKVLGIAGTDQNHEFDNIWGCVDADKITAFSYRLHVSRYGEVENYIYHKNKGSIGCGERFGTGYYLLDSDNSVDRRGEWVQVEQVARVGRTTTSGEIELWINGNKVFPTNSQQASQATGYDFGGADGAYAGGITLTAFFGGNGEGSYSNKDEYTYYRDVELHYGPKDTPANQVQLTSTRQRVYDVIQEVNRVNAAYIAGRGGYLPHPADIDINDIELADESSNSSPIKSFDVSPSGGDGKIDGADYAFATTGFSQAANVLDFNSDGKINIFDISALITKILE